MALFCRTLMTQNLLKLQLCLVINPYLILQQTQQNLSCLV